MRISDWSSDVCSSDLEELAAVGPPDAGATAQLEVGEPDGGEPAVQRRTRGAWGHQALDQGRPALQRSEERRVGKECVSTCKARWSPHHSKTNRRTTDITRYFFSHFD